MGEIRAEREGNKADNVHEIVEAVLARDRRLRKIAVRRSVNRFIGRSNHR